MPNDDRKTTATEDHVVLPVHTGDGNVDHIAFPASTPLPAVHKALLDHIESGPEISDPNFKNKGQPYSDADKSGPFGWKEPQPTKEGSVEYDPKFKSAASKVWEAAAYGKNSNESGTYIDQNLERGPISSSDQEGKMSLVVPNDANSTIHSHPNRFKSGEAGGQPSPKDIQTAKQLGKTVYVVSKSGLQYATANGDTGVVYTSPSQFQK
jgi:hypothetical protein